MSDAWSLPEIALQPIVHPVCREKDIQLDVLRLDQTHPLLSGNKWFKLKYNLAAARAQGKTTLLTFGGAYSNHIHACAAAAQLQGFASIGIIRGEPHLPVNPTLQDAQDFGMQLVYLNRQQYRKKHQPAMIRQLLRQLALVPEQVYIIPEGGSNALAVKGCMEIPAVIPHDYDVICLPCGTGGTLAGIAAALQTQPDKKILGFAVLKGACFLHQAVQDLLVDFDPNHSWRQNWQIIHDYHFGGYARHTPQLLGFIKSTQKQYELPLDFVYSAKMLFGVLDLIQKDYFPEGCRIIALHTGGLQGNRSSSTQD